MVTPSVLKEKSSEYFELDIESSNMLLAPFAKPGKGEVVPAIPHVDNTAKMQTFDWETDEHCYDLSKAF